MKLCQSALSSNFRRDTLFSTMVDDFPWKRDTANDYRVEGMASGTIQASCSMDMLRSF